MWAKHKTSSKVEHAECLIRVSIKKFMSSMKSTILHIREVIEKLPPDTGIVITAIGSFVCFVSTVIHSRWYGLGMLGLMLMLAGLAITIYARRER